MKKIVSILLLLSCVLTLISLDYTANARVAIGSRSEEVKQIQEILKTDQTIYPEGLTTGYFGRLTENAVKKLQKRCGLPETGAIDDATEKCIYPTDYKVKITFPNGGEVLDRNTIYTARWEVTPPEVSIPERPFWTKASLDLFRREMIRPPCAPCPSGTVCPQCPEGEETSIFVRHIAIVNLFDQAYSGRITSDIPNGKDYVIRITWGENIVLLWQSEKNNQTLPSAADIWPVPPPPNLISWDESDGTFEIAGNITPECPTCPVCPPNQNLEQVIAILENMIAELQRTINLLKGMSR